MSEKFTDRDEFSRQVVAENLAKLIASEAQISPILIDGAWGSGKSEFCRKFVNLVNDKKTDVTCVYVDAFKYDHADDPMAMLLTALSKQVKDNNAKKDLLQKAIPVAKVLGKVAGKAAVNWALRTSVDQISDDISEAVNENSNDIIDDSIKRIFEEFERSEESLNTFKESLKKTAEKNRFVVVVDELDRCRPSFALSVIEKVKHVFDVAGITFVIATNATQMEAMIKKQYGNDIDARNYLSKFFHLTVQLPDDHPLATQEYMQNAHRLFRDRVNGNKDLTSFYGSNSSIHEFFLHSFTAHQRSLRDAERFYRNIEIFNSLSGEYKIQAQMPWFYTAIIMFSIYLHTFYHEIATKFLRGKVTPEEIASILDTDVNRLTNGNENLQLSIVALIALDMESSFNWKLLGDKTETKWDARINKLFDYRSDPGRGRRNSIFQSAIRRLRLL